MKHHQNRSKNQPNQDDVQKQQQIPKFSSYMIPVPKYVVIDSNCHLGRRGDVALRDRAGRVDHPLVRTTAKAAQTGLSPLTGRKGPHRWRVRRKKRRLPSVKTHRALCTAARHIAHNTGGRPLQKLGPIGDITETQVLHS
jgi:hypothetical protein